MGKWERACQLVRVRANKMVADVAVAFNHNLITPHSIKRTAYKQMKGDCALHSFSDHQFSTYGCLMQSQQSQQPQQLRLSNVSSLSAASPPPRGIWTTFNHWWSHGSAWALQCVPASSPLTDGSSSFVLPPSHDIFTIQKCQWSKRRFLVLKTCATRGAHPCAHAYPNHV